MRATMVSCKNAAGISRARCRVQRSCGECALGKCFLLKTAPSARDGGTTASVHSLCNTRTCCFLAVSMRMCFRAGEKAALELRMFVTHGRCRCASRRSRRLREHTAFVSSSPTFVFDRVSFRCVGLWRLVCSLLYGRDGLRRAHSRPWSNFAAEVSRFVLHLWCPNFVGVDSPRAVRCAECGIGWARLPAASIGGRSA